MSLMDRIAALRGNPKVEDEKPEAENQDEQAEAEEDEDGDMNAADAADAGAENDDGEQAKADPAEIAAACDQAGVSYLSAELIKANLSEDEAAQRITSAGKITHMVSLARKANPTIGMALAKDFIRNQASVAEVGEALLNRLADSQSPEIRNSHVPGQRATTASADHGWDKAVAKVSRKKVA